MGNMRIAIVDYGSGNLRSAEKSFERAVAELGRTDRVAVTADPAIIAAADKIVLPGVGAYRDCKNGLSAIDGLIPTLIEQVQQRKKPFMGICVGMQLLADIGHEHGETDGLGWIAGDVVPLPAATGLKVPHMGWNTLDFTQPDHPLFAGLDAHAHAYFVHSYWFQAKQNANVLAQMQYGQPLTAVVGHENIIGSQFHPEKSQHTGLTFIANFLKW
jgi:glutamine amidotransferase